MEHLPVATHSAAVSIHSFDSGALGYLFLLIVLLGGILLYTILLYILNLRSKYYFAKIIFPEIAEIDSEKFINKTRVAFDSFFKRIYNPFDKVFFEIVKNDEYIAIQIGSNNRRVLEAVKQAFSQIENCKISDSDNDLLTQNTKLYSRSVYTSQTFYPITKQQYFFDNLIHFLDSVPKGESAGVQFVIRGVRKKLALNWKISNIDQNRKKEKRITYTAEEDNLIKFYVAKRTDNLFKTKIRVFATTKDTVRGLTGLFASLNYDDSDFCSQPSISINVKRRYLAPDSIFTWFIPLWREFEGSYFTSSELSFMFHPSSIHKGTYAPKQTKDIAASPEFIKQLDSNVLIGTASQDDENEKKIYFPLKNFQRHIYLIGKTGRGKSTLLTTLIHALIAKQNGTVIVLDPHGDLLTDILSISDGKSIIYLNIRNKARVFTINPVFKFHSSMTEKAVTRDKLMDIIKQETEDQTGNYQTGSMTNNRMMEMLDIILAFPDAYYLYLTEKRNVPKEKALQMVRERQLTLNDLPLLLLDQYHYYSLFKEIWKDSNTPVGRYIQKLMPVHLQQVAVVEAVKSRLEQLTHSSLQYVFEGNKLKIEEIADAEKTFLFPLQDVVYGDRGTRILMQILFSSIWLYKKSKEDISQRKDTYMIIDEFQNAQINDISKIVSESRKYGLYLTASNQYLSQLRQSIQDTLLGNVGTLVSFGVGAGEIGAKPFAEQIGNLVTEDDLMQLPPYHAIMKTEGVGAKESVTFSFKTMPIEKKVKDKEEVQRINDESLEKYGEKIADLEERMNKKQENPLKFFTEGI